jgi:hypothetical protein
LIAPVIKASRIRSAAKKPQVKLGSAIKGVLGNGYRHGAAILVTNGWSTMIRKQGTFIKSKCDQYHISIMKLTHEKQGFRIF